MNSIITLKRLVGIISKNSGSSTEYADRFIKAFTGLIRDTLVEGESVSINDIGTFSLTRDKRVLFTPSKELAEAVNEPFAMFLPEELASDISPEELMSKVRSQAPQFAKAGKQEVAPKGNPLETVPQAKEPQAEEVKAEDATVVTAEPQAEMAEQKPEADEEMTAEETTVVTAEPQAEMAEQKQTKIEAQAVDEEALHKVSSDKQVAKEAQADEKPAMETGTLMPERPCPTEPQPNSPQHQMPNYQPRPISSSASAPNKPVAPKIEYRANGAAEHTHGQSHSHHHNARKSKPSPFWVIWGAIIGLLIGLGIGFMLHDPIVRWIEPSMAQEDEMTEEMQTIEAADSLAMGESQAARVENAEEETTEVEKVDEAAQVASQQEQSSAAAVQKANLTEKFDTIRPGNSLGSIARKHYGDNVYWVYIYLENKAVIPNPNRIAAGTRLSIPPLSKYSTSTSAEENKAAAQKKANEILSKYPQ